MRFTHACRTAGEVASAEFILVDDGSTEDVSVAVDTGRQLQHLFGAHFRHARNENATGYGPANNMGVQLATAKYVALINTDAHVVNGWLRPLVDTLQLNSGIGMVHPSDRHAHMSASALQACAPIKMSKGNYSTVDCSST